LVLDLELLIEMTNQLAYVFDTAIFGVRAVQSPADLMAWEQFLNRNRVVHIIELGTLHGGMTTWLALQAYTRRATFASFDITDLFVDTPLTDALGLRSLLRVGDIFNEGQPALIEALRYERSPRLLFCDDGDKRREVAVFAPMLCVGDFLAVHDWGSEIGPQDIPAWLAPVLPECCEGSLTRFFVKIHH
jgi:cephalosporin hydroxylase